MKELICIVCPRGCHLKVDEANDHAVSGNACPRGAEYGRNESTRPTRVLTSTVKITGAMYRRCPVRTRGAAPKAKLFDIMRALNAIELKSPVREGDVVISNAADAGVDVIVTKAM